jgi:large subunit ribosomal protein L24
MAKIRKGDQVVVLSGRDKGRQGQVLQVFSDGRVLIENLNKVKKHQKPNPQANPPVAGGIIEKEMPLPMSKVAIWNTGAKKADRIGYKRLADGKKVRFFKSNGEMLDA